MAGIQAGGAISGIDINGLVSQLVAAERAPQEQRLNRAQAGVEAKISAFGVLRGALSALQGSLSALRTEASFRARRADVSDSKVLTAAASSTAANGRYEIEVEQLASAHRLASDPYAGGASTTVGTGTLTITVGSAAFDVVIDASRQSLSGIRDAINGATGNTGVQATLITASNGARLVLSSTRSGAAGALSITQSGGDGGLAALVYTPQDRQLDEIAPARDARILIDGLVATSPSNAIDGAIEGVTLNLLDDVDSPTSTVTVGTDTAQTTEKIRKFVADYNNAIGTIQALRRFDPASRASGPLLGDTLLQSIEGRLRNELGRPTAGVNAAYGSLAALGIRTGADGKLVIDDAKLSAALAADYDAVGRMFGAASGGLAARLYTAVDQPLQVGGALSTRTTDLQTSRRSIDKDREALDRRMLGVEKRYRAQFVAMDQLLAQLQTTGTYLTQQLANVPKPPQG